MNALEFFAWYALTGTFALIVMRPDFRGQWMRLLRTLLGATSICFIVDYPAENRAFWRFSHPSGASVIDIPIENVLFFATSGIIVLVIYLKMQRFFRLRRTKQNKLAAQSRQA